MAGAGIFERWHFPKFPEVDNDDELVNVRTFGTPFHRRQNISITLANAITGTDPYQFPQAATYFQAGLVGVDWILGTTTPGAVTGPTADNLLVWLRGNHGAVSDPALRTYLNLYATGTDDYYSPPAVATSFSSSWTQIFENLDTAATKTITFGTGVTTPTGSTLIIPPSGKIQVTFEVTGPHTVRIMSIINLVAGAGGGIIVPAGPPGFVVQTATGTETSTIVPGNTDTTPAASQNIVIVNGDGDPTPVQIKFGPAGQSFTGPPMDFNSALVWSSVTNRWEGSESTTFNDPNHNAGFPGLRVGSNNSVGSATDLAALYVIGDNPPTGVQFLEVGTTALGNSLVTNNPWGVIVLDTGNSPNFGDTATRPANQRDTGIRININNVTADNPTNNPPGAGAYQYIGQSNGTSNFMITQNGEIIDFTPIVGIAGGTALVADPAGNQRIGFAASRAEYKTEIKDINPQEAEEYFNVLRPRSFQFKNGSEQTSFGFVVQDSEAVLHPSQNVFFVKDGQKVNQNFDDRAIIALLVQQVQLLKEELAHIKEELMK